MSKFWAFKAEGNKRAKLDLYGIISSTSWWDDEISATSFKSDLDALGDIDELDVYINSDGGDVFAGQAIHSMIKRHKAKVTVYIDGIAASIASVIAMAGDKVIMPRNAMMMVHNPWSYATGNAERFRKMADALDNIRESMIAAYEDRTGLPRDEIISLLDAETWLSADQAVEKGFADEIEQSKEVAASIDASGVLCFNGQAADFSRYKNAPKLVVANQQTNKSKEETNHQSVKSLFYYERLLALNEKGM